MPDRDPLQRALGNEDLYDVADWDARTALDRIAVALYEGLHIARRYALLVLATVLFALQLSFAGMLVVRQPRLGVLAVLSAIPAIALVGYVWYGDPTRREPLEPIAITFVLSVLFAAFAALVNTVLNPAFSLVPVVGTALYFFLVVGPIEETTKWLAIRTHAYNQETFDAVIDGAVYGAVAGLGFATIENTLYIAQGYLQAASMAGVGQLEQAVGTATSRALVGPGHVLYSAFAGYYLGLAKFNPANKGPIVVKGILVAAVIHATYNTLVSALPSVLPVWNVLTLVGFVLVFDGVVGYLLYRKLARYRSFYKRATAADSDTASAES